MSNTGLSASLEDYLEAICHIVQQKQAAKARDISRRLDVNSSSVTGALQSLAAKGLVNYAPYDIITLTDEGMRIAEDVIRRHRTLHHFLVRVLAIEDTEAEEAACKMEHVISQKILERLIQFVDFVESRPIGGMVWDDDLGFICKHNEDLSDCDKCMEELEKKRQSFNGA